VPAALQPAHEGGKAGSHLLEGHTFVPPYPPSWVDRVTRAISRLPGPAWLGFLALGVAGGSIQILIQWSTGSYRPGPFLLLHIWTSGNFAFLLAMVNYLDRSAAASIEAFRPVLQPSPSGGPPQQLFADLRYRLTTLPHRSTVWATLTGGIVLTATPILLTRVLASGPMSLLRLAVDFGLSSSPLAFAVFFVQYALTQATSAVVVYHTIHQLRLIRQIYVHHTRLNLYRLQPLYAFSIPAAFTAGGFLLYSYVWFASAPALLAQLASVVLAVFFACIAVVTFSWPLLGIHRRLVEEKKRLLQESSARFDLAVTQLHRRIDRKRLARMDDLNKTLASLELEQAALRRIPTWPWEPGTLRGLLAAIFLPIFIWLIQFGLQRILE
jgi:hypothetical protein